MNLTPEQREQVRLSILRLCLSRMRIGLLTSYLRSEGFRKITAEEVELEIQYLEDKKLLTAEGRTISPENKEYRTTADGRDFLATQGKE